MRDIYTTIKFENSNGNKKINSVIISSAYTTVKTLCDWREKALCCHIDTWYWYVIGNPYYNNEARNQKLLPWRLIQRILICVISVSLSYLVTLLPNSMITINSPWEPKPGKLVSTTSAIGGIIGAMKVTKSEIMNKCEASTMNHKHFFILL